VQAMGIVSGIFTFLSQVSEVLLTLKPT